jgi:hypothetical protein
VVELGITPLRRRHFSEDAELPTKAVSCNCSICRQKGLLLSFFPADKFTLTSGENALTTYEFYAHEIAHRFCMVCGSQPFSSGKIPDGSAMRAHNLRVPSIDLGAVELQYFDGASK